MQRNQLAQLAIIGLAVIGLTAASTIEEFSDNENTRCAINLNGDLADPQPLLIRPRTSEFMNPRTGAGIIRLNRNAAVELFCSSGFRGIETTATSLMATCLGGRNFRVNGDEVEFSDIACNRPVEHTARRTERKCPGGEIAQIGYNVDQRWLNLMDICHDPVMAVTHWVHHAQEPFNRGNQRGYPRIQFIQGDFFDRMQVNSLYTRNRQRRAIGNILRSQQLALDLVKPTGDLFMSRGHLAARTDFIFGTQQQATFYFLNAAPQWHTFNSGNWEDVEQGLRMHVDRRNWNLELYTGTHGILQMNDVNGVPRELFLEERARRIPVPKIFYKIAIDKESRSGIVFVGVNHPYATMEEIKRDFIYCEDVSSAVTYIPWKPKDIKLGYSYACTVEEFAKRIPNLPELPAVDNLLV